MHRGESSAMRWSFEKGGETRRPVAFRVLAGTDGVRGYARDKPAGASESGNNGFSGNRLCRAIYFKGSLCPPRARVLTHRRRGQSVRVCQDSESKLAALLFLDASGTTFVYIPPRPAPFHQPGTPASEDAHVSWIGFVRVDAGRCPTGSEKNLRLIADRKWKPGDSPP